MQCSPTGESAWASRGNHPIAYRDSHDTIRMRRYMESNARSIAKAISYRVLGSASTAFIVYFLMHNAKVALGAGALDSLVKIGMYFIHERIWNHIDFGRPKPPEYEI